MNGADCLILVAVDVGDLGRDALAHVGVKHPFSDQLVDRGPATKRAGDADEGPLQ